MEGPLYLAFPVLNYWNGSHCLHCLLCISPDKQYFSSWCLCYCCHSLPYL